MIGKAPEISVIFRFPKAPCTATEHNTIIFIMKNALPNKIFGEIFDLEKERQILKVVKINNTNSINFQTAFIVKTFIK